MFAEQRYFKKQTEKNKQNKNKTKETYELVFLLVFCAR